jgi:hypothetical protein
VRPAYRRKLEAAAAGQGLQLFIYQVRMSVKDWAEQAANDIFLE